MSADAPRDAGRGPRPARVARAGVLALLLAFAGVIALSATARAASLPDGRAFELVTPPSTDSNGVAGTNGTTFAAVVNDSEVLWGGGLDQFGPGTDSGVQAGVYLAQRTAGGWQSSSVLPASYSPYEGFRFVDATRDLSAMVFAVNASSLSPPADAQNYPNGLVYRDANGNFSTIVSDAPSEDSSDPSSGDASLYGGMSADGQTVYYSSDVTPPSLPSTNGLREVYEWHPGGSVSEAGNSALQQCGVEIAGDGDLTVLSTSAAEQTTNAVSSDGSTVFLASGEELSPEPAGCPSGSQIYVDDGGTMSPVSALTGDTTDQALFEGASPDGRTAYFLQANQLYEWTAGQAGAPATVTCTTCASSLSIVSNGARVSVSENGEYAYIAAPNTAHDQELDVFHAGMLSAVADVPTSTGFGSPAIDPAGNVIVFNENPSNGTTPLYRAVVSAGGVSTPQCLSCQPDGTPGDGTLGLGSNGSSSAALSSLVGASTLGGTGGTSISDDGNTVVFTTDDALGVAPNTSQVYEWTPSGGPQLLADGVPGGGSDAAITGDGQNIIFDSPDQLVPQATQSDTVALYDARVGGGFPAPAAPASCTGDACQAPTPAPPPAATVSSTSACCGNVPAVTVALSRPSDARVRSAARTGRLTVSVTAKGAGMAVLRATRRVGGHTVTVATVRRKVRGTAGHGQRVSLTLRLNAAARAALRRTGVLRLVVSVSLPAARTRTTTVTLHRVQTRASSSALRRSGSEPKGGRS